MKYERISETKHVTPQAGVQSETAKHTIVSSHEELLNNLRKSRTPEEYQSEFIGQALADKRISLRDRMKILQSRYPQD